MQNIPTDHPTELVIPENAEDFSTLKDDLPLHTSPDDVQRLGTFLRNLLRKCYNKFQMWASKKTDIIIQSHVESTHIILDGIHKKKSYKVTIPRYTYDKLKNTYVGTNLINDAYVVATRYAIVDGGNQLAVPSDFYDRLCNKYGFQMELFASPLNRHLKHFCSLFYDCDGVFGSFGNVFNTQQHRGRYLANPPYIESIMYSFSEHVLDCLSKTTESLFYLLIIPDWTSNNNNYSSYKSYNILFTSKWHVFSVKLSREKTPFFDYKNDKVKYPTDIIVVGIGNEKIEGLDKFCSIGWSKSMIPIEYTN